MTTTMTTLPTVDGELLDTVTGGIITGSTFGSTFGSSNLQLQQLQSLLNSLQNNNGCHQNNDGISPLTMMVMALAMRNNERPELLYARPAVWF